MSSEEKAVAVANDLTTLAILDALPPHASRNAAVRLARWIERIDDLRTALRRHLKARIDCIERRFTK